MYIYVHAQQNTTDQISTTTHKLLQPKPKTLNPKHQTAAACTW